MPLDSIFIGWRERGGSGTGGSGSGRSGTGGRNFSSLNIIVATGSAATYQVLRVVTNQPSPSEVCFGPVTLSRLVRTVTCSPCRRYRQYSCSQLVATTEVNPASSST